MFDFYVYYDASHTMNKLYFLMAISKLKLRAISANENTVVSGYNRYLAMRQIAERVVFQYAALTK